MPDDMPDLQLGPAPGQQVAQAVAVPIPLPVTPPTLEPEPEPEPESTVDIVPIPDIDKEPDERRRRRQEILKRLGTSRESVTRLANRAVEAERAIGIHGVSVTAGPESRPHSRALRLVVEALFRVHDTPTRNDPLHRTVELPKPVTKEVADRFNRVFGRI